MELTPLRYFVHVATTRSFVAGARAAHVTPPALSKAIRGLEDELGVRLFERTTRQVRLTHAGEVLLERARTILTGADALRAEVAGAAGEVRGELRIGAMEVFSLALLPDALGALVRNHPDVVPHAFEMPPDDIVAAVQRGALDIGVSIGGAAIPGVVREVLGHSPAVVVCGRDHVMYGRARVGPRELAETSWVVPRFFAHPSGPAVDQYPDAASPRRVGATIELLQSGIRLVAGGLFVGCFPAITIARELADGSLWRLRGGPRIPPFELAWFRPASRTPSPAIRALVRELQRLL